MKIIIGSANFSNKYGINKSKPRPKLNELGYPLDDPYGLIEAFTRVGPKKI